MARYGALSLMTWKKSLCFFSGDRHDFRNAVRRSPASGYFFWSYCSFGVWGFVKMVGCVKQLTILVCCLRTPTCTGESDHLGEREVRFQNDRRTLTITGHNTIDSRFNRVSLRAWLRCIPIGCACVSCRPFSSSNTRGWREYNTTG